MSFNRCLQKNMIFVKSVRMNSSSEEKFCGVEFWNNTLTWDSDNPDFTDCFHKTILAWCPSLILAIFSINEFLSFKFGKNQSIPWNLYNLTKVKLQKLTVIQCSFRNLNSQYSFTLLTDFAYWITHYFGYCWNCICCCH